MEVDGQKAENLNSFSALLHKNKSKKIQIKILRKDERKLSPQERLELKFLKKKFSNGILIKGEKKIVSLSVLVLLIKTVY